MQRNANQQNIIFQLELVNFEIPKWNKSLNGIIIVPHIHLFLIRGWAICQHLFLTMPCPMGVFHHKHSHTSSVYEHETLKNGRSSNILNLQFSHVLIFLQTAVLMLHLHAALQGSFSFLHIQLLIRHHVVQPQLMSCMQESDTDVSDVRTGTRIPLLIVHPTVLGPSLCHTAVLVVSRWMPIARSPCNGT